MDKRGTRGGGGGVGEAVIINVGAYGEIIRGLRMT